MRHRRLFDELRDMQAETNAFFDEVHDRLSRLSAALDGWRTQSDRAEHSVLPNPHGYERIEQHRTPTLRSGQAPMMSGAVITERYERRIYFPSDVSDPQPFREIPKVSRAELPVAQRHALPSGTRTIPVQSDAPATTLARIELDNLRPGDVEISVDGNSLTITGRIYRKIMLPPGVEASQVRASYRDGALELRVTDSDRAKKVDIDFGS